MSPAFTAMLELRGDALPYLIRVAHSRPTIWSRTYNRLVEHLPAKWRKGWPSAHPDAYYYQRQRRALVLMGALAYCERTPHPWGKNHSRLSEPDLLSALETCLHDPNPEIRSAAAATAGNLSTRGALLVPTLIELLQQTNVQFAAVEALGAIGTPASNAVALLTALLPKASEHQHHFIIEALGRIGPPARPAMASLIPWLQGTNQWLQRDVALAMLKTGSTPPEAIPVLCTLTNRGTFYQTRQTASLALWNLDRQNPVLLATCSNAICEDPFMGLAWLHQAKLDGTASNLVPMLRILTNRADIHIQRSAREVLHRVEGTQ